MKEFDRSAIDAAGERRERTVDDLIRINRARAVWDTGVDPRGTPAEAYLRLRGIVMADGIANAVLRFNPATPRRHEDSGGAHVPALIAPFTSLDDGAVTGIQRIALTPEGRKLRSLGGPRDLAQDKAILSCVATGSTLCSEPPRLPNLQRYHRVV